MKWCLCLLSMAFFGSGISQVSRGVAENLSLGNSRVVLENVHAVYNNPAAFSFKEPLTIGLFSGGNNFVKGVGFFGLSFNKVFQEQNSLALGVSRFGYSALNRNRVSLAYARKLGSKCLLGLGIDYENLRIDLHGNKHFVSARAGFRYELNDRINFGGFVSIPTQKSLELVNQEFEINSGVQYNFHEKAFLIVEIHQRLKNSLTLATGIQYNPLQILSLRVGFLSQPTLVSFGTGIRKGILSVDLATSYHLELGIKTDLGVQFLIAKKEDI